MRRRQREHEARQVVHDVQLDRRRTDNRTALIALAVVAVVAIGAQILFSATGGFARPAASEQPIADAPTASSPTTPTASSLATTTDAPTPSTSAAATPNPLVPSPTIAENREWTGQINFNDGALNLDISIDGEAAPQAASNFIALAQQGFFDNTQCHRLTTEGLYVLQCGDPTATGTGGPGYEFGPLENVPADGVYKTGVIAMARSQAEDSMGSQFFIVYQDSPLPAPGYTVFGEVTGGLDEFKQQIVDPGIDEANSNAPGDGKPKAPATITTVTLN